jgi:hypothetical protein
VFKSVLRFSRGALSAILAAAVSGCAMGFPGFTEFWADNIYHYQVGEVVEQVRCEVKSFLGAQRKYFEKKKDKTEEFFASDDVGVKLTLTTDVSGTVNYTGIDLHKLGLTSVAQLISLNKDIPNLGAKLQGKGTITATVDIAKLNFTGESCHDTFNKPMAYFFIKEWLTNFLQQRAIEMKSMEGVSDFKLTMGTKFQLVLGINAGLTPLSGTTYLLPISAVSGDFGPTYTHDLSITFNKVCRPKTLKPPSCKDLSTVAEARSAIGKLTKFIDDKAGDK